MISYAYSGQSLVLHLQGQPWPIDRTHPHWDEILKLLPTATEDELLPLVSIKTFVTNLKIGKVEVGTDAIFYDGKPVHSHLTNRMLEIIKAGLPVEPWCRFMNNLYQNPSKTAIDELYLWLEHSKMPITDDGCFLAFKKVRDDYISFHDGETKNDIGTVVSMPRNKVDDRRDNVCSDGLHFCSYDYLPHYYGSQGKVVVVKINPADVVSIPSDYNNAKGRAWQYLVVEEVAEDKARFAFPDPLVSGWKPEEVEEEEEEEEEEEDPSPNRNDWEEAVLAGATSLGFDDWFAQQS